LVQYLVSQDFSLDFNYPSQSEVLAASRFVDRLRKFQD